MEIHLMDGRQTAEELAQTPDLQNLVGHSSNSLERIFAVLPAWGGRLG
jgi:hypothetical protein